MNYDRTLSCKVLWGMKVKLKKKILKIFFPYMNIKIYWTWPRMAQMTVFICKDVHPSILKLSIHATLNEVSVPPDFERLTQNLKYLNVYCNLWLVRCYIKKLWQNSWPTLLQISRNDNMKWVTVSIRLTWTE